jgi:adenylate kinase
MISIDLRMDSAYIKDNMQIKWNSETGFVDNVQKLIKEYKASRNLIVINIYIIKFTINLESLI